jgi:large subunit ribosomal protein L3
MAFHGMIGRKAGMTQIFDDEGNAVPVSVIELGPNPVVQVRTQETDGYSALQLGFGARKDKHTNQPEGGHFKKAGVAPQKVLCEFRSSSETIGETTAGDTITVACLEGIEYVDIAGTSKGAGFAGVIKRHNMSGCATMTHGTHEVFRHGGSIGNRAFPGRVWKGKNMAGHMGSERVTVQNLKVVRIDAERNILLVRGGVPGHRNAIVEVRPSVKRG